MRVITWNSRGYGLRGYEWRLDTYRPDIMVVQECGNLGDAFPGGPVIGVDDRAVCVGSYDGYNFWWVDWSRTGAQSSNPRCSLAMIYKESGAPSILESRSDNKRPVMCKTIKSSWVVCNVHAGGQDYVKEVLGRWHSLAGDKDFVCAGDFNQEPKNVVPWAKSQRLQVVCTNRPTRPDSRAELDFAVSSKEGTATLNNHYGGSDHISVMLDF